MRDTETLADYQDQSVTEDAFLSIDFIGGSLIIKNGFVGETTLVPLSLAVTASELYTACQKLLDFIKTFDMGGDWNQENYPAIKYARAAMKKALP